MITDDKGKISTVSEFKKSLVKELSTKMQRNRTVLLASSKGLPGKQFHEIKKKLRGAAELKVAKKSTISKAIEATGKGALQNLKGNLEADYVLLFSDMEPFELSGMLIEFQSSRRAKTGDIAPHDIEVEPGPTELVAGPAISELNGVGLKVKVTDGKLEIIKGATVVRKGEAIKANVASVLGKLNVSPMKVGFLPIAAFDGKEDKIYTNLIIDKAGTLETLREMVRKSLGFAVAVKYPTSQTVKIFIAKAAAEEKAIANLYVNQQTKEGI